MDKQCIIICPPRTGSSLLGESLSTHTQIRYGFEVFNRWNNNIPSTKWKIKELKRIYKVDESELFKKGVLSPLLNAMNFFPLVMKEFNLIKIICDHLPLNSPIWGEIKEKKYNIIYLKRNKLDSCISFCLAKNTQIWQQRNNKQNEDKRIQITSKDVTWFIEHFDKHINHIQEKLVANESITINYSDLTKSWKKSLEKIQTFMGIKYENISPVIFKRNIKKRRIVANYGDLYSDLINSKYALEFEVAKLL